ncbi:MAG TPA: hypothetical protein VJR24_02335, partial [Gemmatimonadaceae bacterium]|nr:hypothetical protein [Gemmatimonadaceae bacterium]
VTYQERSLPMTTIVATASSTESFSVRDLDLRTKAWRIVASKNLLWVSVAAGFGRDYYDANARITYNVDGQTQQTPVSLGVSPSRTNFFGDVSLNVIPFVKLVGELGRVSGGSVHTFNSFDDDVNQSRWYGSIGARLAF